MSQLWHWGQPARQAGRIKRCDAAFQQAQEHGTNRPRAKASARSSSRHLPTNSRFQSCGHVTSFNQSRAQSPTGTPVRHDHHRHVELNQNRAKKNLAFSLERQAARSNGDHRRNGKTKKRRVFSPLHLEDAQFHQRGRSDRRRGSRERTEIGAASGRRRRGSATRGHRAAAAGADLASKSGIGARSSAGGGEGPSPSSLSLSRRARSRLRCCGSCFGRRGGRAERSGDSRLAI
jgi:hypothetical protein